MRLLVAFCLASTLSVAFAGESTVYGEAMPEGESVAIGAALEAYAGDESEPRKFSGEVTEVCKNKGCWIILTEGDRFARVMARDHGFSVPFESRGRAVVYGSLSRIEMKEDTAKHLAEDAGKEGAVERVEFRIDATSIALLD